MYQNGNLDVTQLPQITFVRSGHQATRHSKNRASSPIWKRNSRAFVPGPPRVVCVMKVGKVWSLERASWVQQARITKRTGLSSMHAHPGPKNHGAINFICSQASGRIGPGLSNGMGVDGTSTSSKGAGGKQRNSERAMDSPESRPKGPRKHACVSAR